MDVRNCRMCGKLFNYIVGDFVCPACNDKREEKFQEVRKYVRNNPHCTMAQVCDECDVSSGQVQMWIRQERLQFSDDSMIKINCEKCGAIINSGRFCKKCKDDMQLTLAQIYPRKETEFFVNKHLDKKNKMRFLK